LRLGKQLGVAGEPGIAGIPARQFRSVMRVCNFPDGVEVHRIFGAARFMPYPAFRIAG